MTTEIHPMKKLTIFGDGGSRGNPGQAAYGFVIYDDLEKVVYKQGTRIGINTNNVAEYSAVINALDWVEKNCKEEVADIAFFLDSQLVVSQLTGKFRVKHPNMLPLFAKVKQLESRLNAKISYTAIPRAQNSAADEMVNLALDYKI